MIRILIPDPALDMNWIQHEVSIEILALSMKQIRIRYTVCPRSLDTFNYSKLVNEMYQNFLERQYKL